MTRTRNSGAHTPARVTTRRRCVPMKPIIGLIGAVGSADGRPPPPALPDMSPVGSEGLVKSRLLSLLYFTFSVGSEEYWILSVQHPEYMSFPSSSALARAAESTLLNCTRACKPEQRSGLSFPQHGCTSRTALQHRVVRNALGRTTLLENHQLFQYRVVLEYLLQNIDRDRERDVEDRDQ